MKLKLYDYENNLIADLLTLGFAKHPKAMSLSRPSCVEDLFERIEVAYQLRNKRDELALPMIRVGATRWVGTKVAERWLREVNPNNDYTSVIASREDAKAFGRRLAELGPPAVRGLAIEEGPQILAETAENRARAKRVLETLDSSADLLTQTWQLEKELPGEKTQDAKRLASWAGVLHLAGAEDAYHLACLAILKDDTDNFFLGADPLRTKPLMQTIQLVVDKILDWPACDEIMNRTDFRV